MRTRSLLRVVSMLPVLSCLALTLAIAALFAAAFGASGGAVTYPVVVTGGALLCALLVTAPKLWRGVRSGAAMPDVAMRDNLLSPQAIGPAARVAAFGLVWLLYILLLPQFGFLLCTTLALILSLWASSGRLSPLLVVGPAIFVLVLAVLVSVVLYVPVPKSGIDHALDEFIFSLMGGGA